MKPRAEVTADKLRGGFYTPPSLVARCLARAGALLEPGATGLRVLEPSAGDGAFLRALAGGAWAPRVASVLAIEPAEAEAAKARRVLAAAGLPGRVRVESAVAWAAVAGETFDLAVGNPPFVRYQFVAPADRAAADALGARLARPLRAVGNLWIPVLLGALSRLREGGAFAFVVPAELLTGCSAGAARGWLLERCGDVRLDTFDPGSFPQVLQEVVVLSGRRRAAGSRRVRIGGGARAAAGDGPWTRHLLGPDALAALDVAALRPLGDVAAFEVATVTGANAFFCASDATVDRHRLAAWARPLVPRIRHAEGLTYTAADHAATRASGARAWLLDFGEGAPEDHAGAGAYLASGAALGLPQRYKCRIRAPWYRIPGIRGGELLLSKRSHRMPRVVVNAAGALTTDTIYRGRLLPGAPCGAGALAAGFHNSATLLSAELEGRSFGGGVLELVPSEIARLAVPADERLAASLAALDALARAGDAERLVGATDALLCRHGILEAAALPELRAARAALLARRLERAAVVRRALAA